MEDSIILPQYNSKMCARAAGTLMISCNIRQFDLNPNIDPRCSGAEEEHSSRSVMGKLRENH